MLGNSTISNSSSLRESINSRKWLGDTIPDLVIGGLKVRLHIIGDCAFQLDVNMMKSSSESEMQSNPRL